MKLSRRELLAVFGGGVLSLPAVERLMAQDGGLRIRENVATFSQDPRKVTALRRGVRAMKNRSRINPHDPLGWDYWASVHGSLLPPEQIPQELQSIYNTCDHSVGDYVAEHFVTWHRAYLFIFEAVLMWSADGAGGEVAIDLPYWDWYANPDIPRIFTTGNAQSNALFHPRARNTVLGPEGTPLSRDWLDQTSFFASTQGNGFSSLLEGDPHGAVHGAIGGDMGFITRSARDPIFWLHHCNIDRLWSLWISNGQGRSNPTDNANWMSRQFTFNAQGDWTWSAADMLDSRALGYLYDDEGLPPVAFSGRQQRTVQTVRRLAPGGQGGAIRLAEAVQLGNRSVSVDVSPPSSRGGPTPFSGRTTGGEAARSTKPAIVLEGVEIAEAGRNGGFSYTVKAQLAASTAGQQSREYNVGVVNTFTYSAAQHRAGGPGHSGASHGGGAPAANTKGTAPGTPPPANPASTSGKVTMRFPLNGELAKLAKERGASLAKDLRVTFASTHEGSGSATASYVRISDVRIEPGS